MSYYSAKDIFNDSLQYVDAQTDPAHHNLNAGLCHLTTAIEADMIKIRRFLSEIEARLQDLEQK
ncbi:MAG: hypothetical protein ACUZ77_07610 [Candidatus Brocadiales bacterium]